MDFDPKTTQINTKNHINLTVIGATKAQHDELNLKGGDLLVHCGDFIKENEYEFEDFLNWLQKQNYEQIVLIPGNRDLICDPKCIPKQPFPEQEKLK